MNLHGERVNRSWVPHSSLSLTRREVDYEEGRWHSEEMVWSIGESHLPEHVIISNQSISQEVTAPGQVPQLPQPPQPKPSIKGSMGRSERGRKKKTKDPGTVPTVPRSLWSWDQSLSTVISSVAGGKRKKTLSKDSTAKEVKEKTPAESVLPDPRVRYHYGRLMIL